MEQLWLVDIYSPGTDTDTDTPYVIIANPKPNPIKSCKKDLFS